MYKNQYPEITLDEIQTFIRLYNEDHQVKEIAKIVHRDRHVVSRHLKRSGVIVKHGGYVPRKISIPPMDVRFSAFLGYIFADGWEEAKAYGIGFANKDSIVLQDVRVLIKQLFNKNIPIKFNRSSQIWYIRLRSKVLFNCLHQFLGFDIVPEKILNGSDDLKSSFLRALFTGDGHVTLSLRKVGGRFYLVYCVCLSCRNRKLQSQYRKMLNDLHIKCNQSPEGLVIKRKNCIKLFKNKIGFLNGAKIFKSPYWKICEKNAILNTICNFNRISFSSPDEGWSYILKKVKQKTD